MHNIDTKHVGILEFQENSGSHSLWEYKTLEFCSRYLFSRTVHHSPSVHSIPPDLTNPTNDYIVSNPPAHPETINLAISIKVLVTSTIKHSLRPYK